MAVELELLLPRCLVLHYLAQNIDSLEAEASVGSLEQG